MDLRKLNEHTHTWAPTFSRGGEEYLKKCYTPKNGSRGGDTFCFPRGGVEGGKGGGTNHIFAEENKDFCENTRKKSKVF